MDTNHLFNPGPTHLLAPKGDTARQAVDSLRGYAYQAMAAALAWLDIGEDSRLYLEVAEDYAVVAREALQAVQVKDTHGSGSITLNSPDVRRAVAAFVDLAQRNPETQVELRFFTTSEMGIEHAIADRPAGMAGLEYWRKVAAGADPSPLRNILESGDYPEAVRVFSKERDDDALRRDLIDRIHWDCGKPDLLILRQELEERLVVLGRERFHLSFTEAQGVADLLVYRVLQASVLDRDQERVLTRAKLYETIDVATRVSMPRIAVEAVTRALAEQARSPTMGIPAPSLLSVAATDWLVDGETLPQQKGIVPRDSLESSVTEILGTLGIVVLVGGSGLGKTTVARAVAVARGEAFFVVDFRNAGVDEARHRLDAVFARMGGLPPSILVLEDLNELDDPQLSLSLARVIESLRRRNRNAIVTCYRKPSAKALTDAGIQRDCVVNCPYLSEEDAGSLVLLHGGDPSTWGRLAYLAGAGGHPQLTHAFVSGIAARGWPVDEIPHIVGRGLSSEDIDAARDAARRSLASALPQPTRDLLYRLSLVIGDLHRPLALAIGQIPPQLTRAGECLDELVGPWIEARSHDRLRISPLARRFGTEMLTADEQQRVHETIALQMVTTSTLDPSDIDTILIHGLLGKSALSLAMLAYAVLTADSRTLALIAEHLLVFRLLKTDTPIFSYDSLSSTLLRIAQFRLAVAGSEGTKVSTIAAALLTETDRMPNGEVKNFLEPLALLTVLGTTGAANYFDDWVPLLVRLEAMVESDPDLLGVVTAVGAEDADRWSFVSGLFHIGSANLASVERLEHVVNEVDKLSSARRASWLRPIADEFSDYSVFINGPWVAQPQREALDAKEAAIRYQRMAEKTRAWGIRALTLQCSVAQAIMLDEYLNDADSALAVLENRSAEDGEDGILGRAMAKICFRRGDHAKALSILRSIADYVGPSAVDRAFTLREAAIAAAKCGDLLQAEAWFLEASSAAQTTKLPDMTAMAIGLNADAAVTAFQSGNVTKALTRLVEVVDALAEVNPEETLRTAYCHRVIRHTVLWLQARIEGSAVKVGDEPIAMDVGTCSNPDPLPAIKDRPLGHIDLTWYMLAEAETVAGIDIGVTSSLNDRIEQGPIPLMELYLQSRIIQMDIGRLDAVSFVSHFMSYLGSAVYVMKDLHRLKSTFDTTAPERSRVPPLPKNATQDPRAEQLARDAFLAYAIRSVFSAQPDALSKLATSLADRFGASFPGKALFDHWAGNTGSLGQLDQRVLTVIKEILRAEHVKPDRFCLAGIILFQRIDQSNFKGFLTDQLATWQRSGWKRILNTESFRLLRPRHTVPRIEEVLKIPTNGRSFLAKLFLATAEAVGCPLGLYGNTLRDIAEEAESPK